MKDKSQIPSFEDWKSRGKYIEVFNKQLFFKDEGERENVLVILHGFPSSSYDYYKVIPYFTKHFRVIIHDHLGFGFSDKPLNYSYSLIEQADHALELWKSLGLKKVNIIAHDYGTSVLTEILWRKNNTNLPIEIASVSLGNGSMLIEMASLIWTQKVLKHHFWGPVLARFSSKFLFVNNFKKLWYDKSKIELEEFDVLWKMLIDNDGRKVLPYIGRYVDERKKFWHRWIGALAAYQNEIHLIWADKDPIAVYEMALVLNKKIPNNKLTTLQNVGHYPMLEAPEQYADAIINELINNG